MVNDVVLQPDAGEPIDFRGEGAICLTERFECIEPLARVGDTDPVDELVELDVGEREGGLLYRPAANGGPPGEVSAELAVTHGIVCGEI